MIELLCDPDMCGCHTRRARGEAVFDNRHVHNYPEAHDVLSDSALDETILTTGMVRSKSELKRLRKQGGLKVEEGHRLHVVTVGQRRLLIYRSSAWKEPDDNL